LEERHVFESRDLKVNEENFIEEKDTVDIPILGNKNTDREDSESEGEIKEDRALEEAPITNNEDVETDSDDEATNLLPEPLIIRGRGRPKIIRTGKPGRPRKQFHEAKIVMSLSTEIPATLEEAINSKEKEKWLEAMNSEIKSLNDCNTWILVDKTHDMHVISCKWVFNIKRRQNGEIDRYKAQLVARGFEQRSGIDYKEIYAPVARIETIRLMLALSIEENLHVHQMEVVTAYVQGKLSNEIYMEQPPMFETKLGSQEVGKLLRPIYGLKQSGRE